MKKSLRGSAFVVQAMRISVCHLLLVLFCSSFALAHDSEAQELLRQRVSLQVHDQSLKKVLTAIEKQTAVKFLYRADLVENLPAVTLQVTDKPLDQVLEQLLAPGSLTYTVSGRQIVLGAPRAGRNAAGTPPGPAHPRTRHRRGKR